MTKADIVDKISREVDLQKKDIAFIIDSFFEMVKGSLAEGESMELRGFGTFGFKVRKGRKARNPRSGEPVFVEDRVVIAFKPGKEFKELARQLPVDKVHDMSSGRKRRAKIEPEAEPK